MSHRNKLRLAKQNGSKDINPSFILPRISVKEAGQMEDTLSTVVLPARIFTDWVEDEFCSITRPQVGTSLSGSTMSSTTQARSERSMAQISTYSEKTVQNQLKMNPQQEEEKSSEDGERFQSSQEEQREGNRTPEERFPPATRRKNGSIWK